MRWPGFVLLLVVVLVPSVSFAGKPLRLELGASSGMPGRAPEDAVGLRVGLLHQPWEHVGFAFDVHHFFLGRLDDSRGLHSYDTATVSVRVSGAIGPVRLFFAPGAGLAFGRYVTGDTTEYARTEIGLGVALRAGAEVAVAEHFVVGTAAHMLVSLLDPEWGPEGNLGVELYGACQF
jgi:hypothetical protein